MRPPALPLMLSVIALVSAMALPTAPAHAQSAEALQRTEAEIRRASEAHQELDAQRNTVQTELYQLQGELIELAVDIQTRERELAEMDQEIAELQSEEQRLSDSLAAEQQRLVASLSALTRINRLPQAALLVRPGDARDTAHAALLLGHMGPQLQEQVYNLNEHLADLTLMRQDLSDQRAERKAAHDELVARSNLLNPQVETRQKLDDKLEREVALSAKRLDTLAEEADSMRDLLDKLAAERRAAAMTSRVSSALAARDAAFRRIAEEEAEAARRAEEEAARRKAEEERLAALAAEEQAVEDMANPEGRLSQVAIQTLRRLPEESETETPPAATTGQEQPENTPPTATTQPEQTGRATVSRPAGIPQPDSRPRQTSRSRIPALPDGKVLRPVAGRVLRAYGSPDKFGAQQDGIALAGASNGLVLAPRGGIVEFSGEWGSYGRLLILAHGDEYHSILGGLGAVFVSLGQEFSAGEPLGRLPVNENGTSELYLEIRKSGKPLDPTALLHDAAR
ncbi:MAG: hypothetical protein Alpg2KO_04760 [Alphaproteobacteria bacterium]